MTLKTGADNALSVCMNVGKRDKVLVVTDRSTERVGQAIFESALEISPKSVLMTIRVPETKKKEPASHVASAMQHSNVVLICTERTLTHTKARIKACEAGARIASMPGINQQIFSWGGMQADYKEIASRAKSFLKRYKRAKNLKVSCTNGTEIEFSIKGRKWWRDTGMCRKAGCFTNLPAGSVFITPKEYKSEGTIYFDGGIEGRSDKVVRVVVKKGRGNIPKYANVEDLVQAGKCATTISRIGMGLNPRSKFSGVMIEDTKVEGNVHIGFGENHHIGGKIRCRVYYEGIIRRPNLTIDEETVIENGKIVIDL